MFRSVRLSSSWVWSRLNQRRYERTTYIYTLQEFYTWNWLYFAIEQRCRTCSLISLLNNTRKNDNCWYHLETQTLFREVPEEWVGRLGVAHYMRIKKTETYVRTWTYVCIPQYTHYFISKHAGWFHSNKSSLISISQHCLGNHYNKDRQTDCWGQSSKTSFNR